MDLISGLRYEAERLRRAAAADAWKLPPERPGHPADEALTQRRAAMDSMQSDPMQAAVDAAGTTGVTARETTVGGVACVVVEAPGASSVIAYLHGGGYRVGSARGWVAFGARMAAACRARVVLVDYRLAPEHPFPAAVHDAVSVLESLRIDDAATLPVLVGGDSAGGGLAAALALACTRAGVPVPAGLILLSPWCDLTQRAGSYRTRAQTDRLFSLESAQEASALYLQGHDASDPLASPLLADPADLAGFPPTLVVAGGHEVLLDDAIGLATRLAAAHVPVELQVEAAMQHVFPVLFPDLAESGRALASIARLVARVTAPS